MFYFELALPFLSAHNGSMFKNTLSLIGLAALVAPALAADWMTDLPAAEAKAAQESKSVLVNFTGSDWCGYCIRLHKEIFSKPDFDAYVKDKFVLAEVDLPHKSKLSPEQVRANQELCEKYNVQGFPTILVLNPEGKVLGGFCGYRPNLDEVKKPLEQALENARLLQEASKLQGAEKAAVLLKVYRNFPESMQEYREELRDEIIALDPDNTTGLKGEADAARQMQEFMEEARRLPDDGTGMTELLESQLQRALPANKIRIGYAKFNHQLQTANTVEQLMEAKKTLMEFASMDAEHGDAIKSYAEAQFADPESLLERLRRSRGQAK